MSFVAEEDDDFGLPNSNSKLSSLFRDTLALPADNKALTFTAPKRPGNQDRQIKHVSAATDHQEVISAAAVTCYKLNHDKYEALQGKVGLALLGNHEKCLYSIILYVNKQKPLASSRVTKEFKFVSQPDNFCTFYDDSRQNWAVLFDSSDVTRKFVAEVEKVLALLENAPSVLPKEASSASMEPVTNNPPVVEENSKTKLISRMAKLGQPILPLKGAAVAEDSDSDTAVLSSTETEQEAVKPRKPSRPEKPSLQKPPAQPVNETMLLNPTALPTTYYSFLSGQQSVPMLPYPGPPLSYSASPAGNNTNYYETLLSETRTQNSEIRMHLCRLMDKIDYLTQQRQSASPDMLELKSNFSKLLGQSSQQSEQLAKLCNRATVSRSTLAEESNEKARTEDKFAVGWQAERESLKSAASKLKEDNDQLASLMQIKAEEHQAIQRRVEQLEDENSKLRESLNKAVPQVNETLRNLYEEENRNLRKLLDDQNDENEKLSNQHAEALCELKIKAAKDADMLNELRQELEEKTREIFRARQERSSLGEELSQANQQIVNLKNELSRAKTGLAGRPELKRETGVIDQVKSIMNKVYKEITKQFQPEETYAFKNIKAVVGTVIRETTLQMLNQESEVAPPDIEKPLLSGPINGTNTEESNAIPVEARKTPDQSPQDPSAFEIRGLSHEESPSTIPARDLKLGNANGAIEDEKLHDALEKSESSGEMNQRAIENIEEIQQRSSSLEETLQTSLAVANSEYNRVDPSWKPDPPPLPPLRDFEDYDDDDWVS